MYIYNVEKKSPGQNDQQLSNFDILLKQLLKTGLMYTPVSYTIYLVFLSLHFQLRYHSKRAYLETILNLISGQLKMMDFKPLFSDTVF